MSDQSKDDRRTKKPVTKTLDDMVRDISYLRRLNDDALLALYCHYKSEVKAYSLVIKDAIVQSKVFNEPLCQPQMNLYRHMIRTKTQLAEAVHFVRRENARAAFH